MSTSRELLQVPAVEELGEWAMPNEEFDFSARLGILTDPSAIGGTTDNMTSVILGDKYIIRPT